MATAPGEFTDDSKLSTSCGMSLKIFNVDGPKLAPFETITTQDFILDTGKEFLAGLQTERRDRPKLSDNVKGAVSTVVRVTNAALNAVGANSEKLDFYGHAQKHPLAEPYSSQTPIRYGESIAKLAAVPASPALLALESETFDPESPDVLRDATVAYFKGNPAEFDVRVQLNTGLDEMPIEDAQAKWSEENSQYQTVAHFHIPVQNAFDPTTEAFVDGDLSFSPAHTLTAHRPLGSINRARLVAYTALSTLRRNENHRPTTEPTSIDQVPA